MECKSKALAPCDRSDNLHPFSAGCQAKTRRQNSERPLRPQRAIESCPKVKSNRRHCVDLVFTTSQIYGSLQPSSLFSAAQCAGANLAPCSSTWHPQSLFCNPRRAALGIDFHVSQYPAKFPTGTRLFAALSIAHMSRYLYNDI